jgi:hypothetical protein
MPAAAKPGLRRIGATSAAKKSKPAVAPRKAAGRAKAEVRRPAAGRAQGGTGRRHRWRRQRSRRNSGGNPAACPARRLNSVPMTVVACQGLSAPRRERIEAVVEATGQRLAQPVRNLDRRGGVPGAASGCSSRGRRAWKKRSRSLSTWRPGASHGPPRRRRMAAAQRKRWAAGRKMAAAATVAPANAAGKKRRLRPEGRMRIIAATKRLPLPGHLVHPPGAHRGGRGDRAAPRLSVRAWIAAEPSRAASGCSSLCRRVSKGRWRSRSLKRPRASYAPPRAGAWQPRRGNAGWLRGKPRLHGRRRRCRRRPPPQRPP